MIFRSVVKRIVRCLYLRAENGGRILVGKWRWGSITVLAVGALGLACNPSAAELKSPSQVKPEPVERDAKMPEQQDKYAPVTETLFGVKVADPFRWLEDEKDPKVQSWMQRQASFATLYLENLPRRSHLVERLKQLLYVEQRGIPRKHGKRYFIAYKPADAEKTLYYYRDGKSGKEHLLLDPNTMSEDGSISVGGISPSRDGRYVVYEEQPNAADEATLRLMEVDSKKLLEGDAIFGTRFAGPSWAPDNSGFYYTWRPSDESVPVEEQGAFAEFRFHRLGTPPAQDETIFPKTGDASKFLGGYISYDGRYLVVRVSHGWSQDDVYVKALKGPALLSTSSVQAPNGFVPLMVGVQARASVFSYKDRLFVQTDWDAPRGRLFEIDPAHAERSSWKEIVPEDASSVLEDASVVGGHLVLQYLHNAYTSLQVRTLDGKLVRKVKLPAIGTASNLIGNEEEDEAYYSFSSFTHPPEVRESSIASGRQRRVSQTAVDVRPEDYEVEQYWATSKDGTRVPYFMVYRKGLTLDGSAPTLLTGYGGFNISRLPYFVSSLFPWLDAGGVFVSANLRGGGEFGERWHQAGMREHKQNVFDDFYAVAEALFDRKVTQPSLLGISGRSNGGLLVGAAVTQRPELFGAVICGVPLLDMVRYPKFGLGKAWIPEYGDPDNPEDFRFLYAYSPYHHLPSGVTYPPLLMASADTDDRVDPMHARKFIALLLQSLGEERSKNALLRIEQNAGHAGGDMRIKAVEQAADEYAFLLNALQH